MLRFSFHPRVLQQYSSRKQLSIFPASSKISQGDSSLWGGGGLFPSPPPPFFLYLIFLGWFTRSQGVAIYSINAGHFGKSQSYNWLPNYQTLSLSLSLFARSLRVRVPVDCAEVHQLTGGWTLVAGSKVRPEVG